MIAFGAHAQTSDQKRAPGPHVKKGDATSTRISLTPRFVPGQTFRYEMEFETRTDTRRSGLGTDLQGPTSLVVNWNATVRMDVLPADASTPGGIRLRTTYEKSAATVTTDSFDPAADETANQYKKLEGKVVEFTLDADRKVKSVAGLEGMVDTQKASQSAHDWISQLSASAGAPSGGVTLGQSWISDQPADSLPIAGLLWRTNSTYMRNEPCHPANAEIPQSAGAGNVASAPLPTMDCAVILANLNLLRGKGARNETPADLRNNGVQSQGKWEGSGQSLLYVSLGTGMVVSVTQTGSEQMDVTLTNNHSTSLHYAGTITTRSQVALLADDARGK
ncbi:MAG TPA: hypothetical protein VFE02_08025 [Candidatus Acidoferrales bacterium]|jgi:hypothetical protein|nr:hypothetical protein [Candidatus Acidoferrales bacterium]